MNQPVEAVVFDVGNVLVLWDRRLPYANSFEDSGELDWFMETVIPLDWHARHDAGTPAAVLVAERVALFPQYETHIRDWFARFNESVPGPVPGSPDIVEALHARGVPLYAITNFGADTWAGFRPTFPLLDRFRDIVVSGIEKLSKPHAPIFEHAAARFGHAPGAMLFVDDHEPNIAGAKALGWQVHHFSTAATLEADLRARGLLE